jgi:hypothetical protein
MAKWFGVAALDKGHCLVVWQIERLALVVRSEEVDAVPEEAHPHD